MKTTSFVLLLFYSYNYCKYYVRIIYKIYCFVNSLYI